MLFNFWRKMTEKAPPRRPGKQPQYARPELESLEGRLVPAAIRNLPGFTMGTLNNTGQPIDDQSTPAVNLGFTINFFGVNTSTTFINENGNITLAAPLSTFTPFGLTTNIGTPIIAPFFADVDTRPGTKLTFGQDTLCGRKVFGVDWIHVDYFNATSGGHVSKFNDFQVILIDRSDTGAGNFDIEFNYNSITWETGDASGGTNGLGGSSAVVGYSNGTGNPGTFAQLPGSGVNGAFLNGGPNALTTHLLNSTTPGRYHYFVRNGQVLTTLNPNVMTNITGLVSSQHPLRYIYDRASGLYRGNVTVVNTRPGGTVANTDACLDEVTQAQGVSGAFQMTIVYRSLPPGVQLANRTGVTASGHPYITTPTKVLFLPGKPVRFTVLFRNPLRLPLSTFLQGPAIQVWAGPFDPTKA